MLPSLSSVRFLPLNHRDEIVLSISTDACKTANCTITICGTVVGIIDDTKTAVSTVNGTANTVLGQGVADIVTVSHKRLD